MARVRPQRHRLERNMAVKWVSSLSNVLEVQVSNFEPVVIYYLRIFTIFLSPSRKMLGWYLRKLWMLIWMCRVLPVTYKF